MHEYINAKLLGLYTKEMREKMGITEGLVRVFVGIEYWEDILGDFAQGLA